MGVREKRAGGKGPTRSGAAAIEFAIILPLLATIVLACVDFGRFAYHYSAVTNAVRAGAANGMMNPYLTAQYATWQSNIQNAARDEMEQQTGYDRSALTVIASSIIETTGGQPNGLRRVRVDASYPFQTLVAWPGIPNNVTLRRAVEMRAIR